MLVFNDQVFRTLMGIASVGVLFVFYLIGLDTKSDKNKTFPRIIQTGGTSLTDKTLKDIQHDLKVYHSVCVVELEHRRYLIQIYDERE